MQIYVPACSTPSNIVCRRLSRCRSMSLQSLETKKMVFRHTLLKWLCRPLDEDREGKEKEEGSVIITCKRTT